MRTGTEDSGHDELLFQAPASPTVVSPPPTALTHAHSSVVGMMPMQPMPANVMSPDDMLRAYAGRRPTTPSNASFPTSTPTAGHPNISYPMPVQTVNYDGNGMRTLYSPVTPATPSSGAPMMAHPYGQPHEEYYPDDDAYAGVGKAE